MRHDTSTSRRLLDHDEGYPWEPARTAMGNQGFAELEEVCQRRGRRCGRAGSEMRRRRRVCNPSIPLASMVIVLSSVRSARKRSRPSICSTSPRTRVSSLSTARMSSSLPVESARCLSSRFSSSLLVADAGFEVEKFLGHILRADVVLSHLAQPADRAHESWKWSTGTRTRHVPRR